MHGVRKYRISFWASNAIFTSQQKEKKISKERHEERTQNTMREQEKARIITLKQEYSRTFDTILQLSISLPFPLYIYERLHVSNSDI